ncbi:MAG: glycerol-3-phosphate acyltransferase [Clostridia bacterium]|nr:glycerol-3-phosphate acyltransferase [Clostridia bacterium]
MKTLNIVFTVLLGYLIGSINPAAIVGKIKKQDLRRQGTKNLGASNTMLVIGKGWGALVMLFDIVKAFAAVKLASFLFPALAFAGLLSGCSAVLGHVFPFYLKFKGGKGLASFGGMILGVDPILFLILLVIATVCMFIVNYSYAMPMSAGVLFPILYGLKTHSLVATLLAIAVSLLIIVKHWSNIGKARRGEDKKITEYAKKLFNH